MEKNFDSDTSRTSDNSNTKTTIVGIGASAGGVRALQQFVEALPEEPGAAIVVIVHLDPQHHSELPQILASHSSMSVVQVTQSSILKENCIYVIPPDRQLRISDGVISAVPFEEPRGQRAPVDLFFRSLAKHGDGFAVILTGAGSDGAAGVKFIKEAGGIVLVQDPDEAEFDSMPRSAIATDAADFILPISDLVRTLVDLIQNREQVSLHDQKSIEEDGLRRLLTHLRVRTGHDFTAYKRSTVLRRIMRRMQVVQAKSLEEYIVYLRDNAQESRALLADLLISVTMFFRDPTAFDALATKVIPRLFQDKKQGDALRIWVAGCATGEEAYSIAMLLLEETGRQDFQLELQIFGSDLDNRALNFAREGRYPVAIEADLSPERLDRFFMREGDHYLVKRELRETVLFANHSLLRDPPFSRLDLITCRNVLIYLNRDLQQQVISTLHYGLTPSGFLFLGSSESADHPESLFRVLDREERIYQNSGRLRGQLPTLPRVEGMPAVETMTHLSGPRGRTKGIHTIHRQALEVHAPPSIIVDNTFRITHLSENAGRYLQPPAGALTSDITELVRHELRFELRSALHRALESGEVILTAAIWVRFNGAPHRVYMQVRPVEEENEPRCALVLFIEGEANEHAFSESSANGGEPAQETNAHLRQELEFSQSQLALTREEAEAANEELRAANEELQSINEEYRSTAEELETSKEELQSINEELQTVNSELSLKLESVSRVNSDLQNLMAATDYGTLFLDRELKIKLFTPRCTELFNITSSDTGRLITDFTHHLGDFDIIANARHVLSDLTPKETEIRSQNGKWHLARFRPYRTTEDRIDGVVVTFIDITTRRETEDALRKSEASLRRQFLLVERSHAPIFTWELEGGIVSWNRGSEELYGYSEAEAIGAVKYELLRTTVEGSSFKNVKTKLREDGVWSGELQQINKDGQAVTAYSYLELAEVEGAHIVFESALDISERKSWEQRQDILLHELSHRVKNTLAVVQSLVHQTWQSNGSNEHFLRRIDGRISALAAAHDLLFQENWDGIALIDLVQSQLGNYIELSNERLHHEGPPVHLSTEVAIPLGLIFHELATNAAKYGALSNETGKVELSWTAEDNKKGVLLKLIWQEADGPPVTEKPTAGFGSRLIQSGLRSSIVRVNYLKDGVRCEIEICLPEGAKR